MFNNKEQVVGDNSLDSSQVESEVEILRSESIALAVVKELKLTDDPEFVDAKPGLWSWLFGAPSDDARTRTAVNALRGGLSVRRVGLTHVLEISFRSPDRNTAARIANAFAQAYVTEQLNVKYEVGAAGQQLGCRSASPSFAISLAPRRERSRLTKRRTILLIRARAGVS